ncbi:MAG: pyridoxamine 5'-phosphate oxidase family protein [Spirochaetaceae bacterium]|jgi:uncharacterized pyridoxamine 5'-phosphate oxidase family protein|nr:pyridoxamine 5'-phosphate oxidase family protein [Spirochaetaceae bacterium]
MEEVLKFLQGAQTFYLATVEGDQPRVRPMGFVMIYKDRLYFSTNNTKPMYNQIKANPKVEFCAFGPGGQWIRISGKVAFDSDADVQEKALETSPQLKGMYSVGDGKFTLFYFEKGAKATIEGFQGGKKEITL